MKIGILITSISNFGKRGFYNSQEIGLAKELSKSFTQVLVYKLVDVSEYEVIENINGFDNIKVYTIPSKNFGINGLLDTNKLDSTLDVLVYFSDTQLCVPKVYKWSKTNGVKIIPYIGVVESHSDNIIKKIIINFLFGRNISVYKKCRCMAKTPLVQEELRKYGVTDITIAPVGLDLNALKTDYKLTDCNELKNKWGYSQSNKVLLFIGRFVQEKQPVKMVEIFYKLYKKNSDYRLLMVGNGILQKEVETKIASYSLNKYVKMIDSVPNGNIWEIYRISDVFVNLNRQEIFGMVLLEAMYYECIVVAWTAPGPNYIIEHNVSGYLVNNSQQLINYIIKKEDHIKKNAHIRVEKNLTWATTAKKIIALVG